MNNLFTNSYLREEANPSYALTKQAIILWMKQRALSLSERKIRLNTISPGIVETPMLKDFNALAKKDLTKGSLVSGVGRTATAEDQAKALLFINSDLASYVSGIDLQVDYAATATMLYAFN
jgi:NAD(P)-dependent dehydrogenase (short-subunit alcohol dehydrogenase family)